MYFVIKFLDLDRSKEELLSTICFEYEAQGISEILEFEQNSEVYEATVVNTAKTSLEVYFLQAPGEEFLAQISSQFPEVQFEVQAEEDKDWLLEWKKDYKAFELVPKVWIVPSWLESPNSAELSIHIDPGMAFGTGTHPTTQIASKWVYDLCKEKAPNSAIDVGCGTCILSILLAKLGCRSVVATEIEPMAREVGKKNIIINKIDTIKVLEHQIDKVNEDFDLVVANIIDGVLLNIKSDLIRCCKPDGRLLLTGVLEERGELFETKFIQAAGLKLLEKRKLGDWLGYLVEKSGK